MVYTSLVDLTDAQKEELVASLSCLIIGDNELTAEKLTGVASASGNSLSDAVAALFVGVVSKAPKGIESFTPPPGGGGGGGGSGSGAAAAAAPAVEEKEEEEEEADLGGGMDMFGGGGGGGDY